MEVSISRWTLSRLLRALIAATFVLIDGMLLLQLARYLLRYISINDPIGNSLIIFLLWHKTCNSA